MPPKLALIACIVFIGWLFAIDRKKLPSSSAALWIPTIWLMIMMSRPVGAWFTSSYAGSVAEGSVYDRYILNTLTIFAILILIRRQFSWSSLVKNNSWLLFLYAYLGASVLWSDFIFISFKRWIKITEIIIVACVILTEKWPLDAMERVLRRCTYVLIPLSVVLIKYFPAYGRSYSRYEGIAMGTGVTTQKNTLGALCAVSAVFFIWRALCRVRSRETSMRRVNILGDAVVFGIAIFLLFGGGGTYSATSILMFFIGTACLILFFHVSRVAQFMTTHLRGMLIVGVSLFIFFHSMVLPIILPVLHRREDLTDRDKIWSFVLKKASDSPIIGTGYGGFWGLTTDSTVLGVNQAHNGYLDVYLQVGILGLVLLFGFLLKFSSQVQRELNHRFEWGVFGVCFLVMTLLHNYTEGSFLRASLMWSLMVFLTVIFSQSARAHEEQKTGLSR